MMTFDDACALDAADPLAGFRDRFRIPEGLIYLDGNSLGALPRTTPDRLASTIEREWGTGLIASWNEAGWLDSPLRVGAKIARLIGASADEVVACDSTSLNLFKLVMAAAGTRPGAIVAEADNFPTDAHIARRAAELLGREFRMISGAETGAAIDDGVAVAIVTHVNYRTAHRHDMAALNAHASASGTHIVWDLSHSAGAVPLDLARDGATLAVGCGYKYLNGGPGAPAWLYVERALQPVLTSPTAGWWGHKAPFDFEADFVPAPGISRFLVGTPPILGLAALEEGIDLLLEADMKLVWQKAIALFDLFAARIALLCPELVLASPREAAKRGSHIAFRHPAAYPIVRALAARNVVGDFRAPDIARFGLTPLTLGYRDIWSATETIATILRDGSWQEAHYALRNPVP
jgi:kynureninase